MEFLFVIAIIIFAIIMWTCLKVASDSDDIIEKMLEKKRNKNK